MSQFRVTSDKELNRFGFRILVDGIDTTNFLDNPIMLHNHNSDKLPIGTWSNLSASKGEMFADPMFDEADDFAVKVKSKVDKGIIKMASIGVNPIQWSDDPKYKLPGQTLPTLVKSELKEISITSFGAVRTAVKLMDNSGKVINDADIDTYIKQSINSNNNIEMTNDLLVKQCAALGLSEKTTEAELLAHVIKSNNEVVTLKAANTTLTTEKSALEAENASLKLATENAEKNAILKKAVEEKKISQKESDVYVKLSVEDIKAVVDTKKPATDFNAMIADANKNTEDLMKLSWDELDKSNKLITLKEQNYEGFKIKFKEEFKKDYQG